VAAQECSFAGEVQLLAADRQSHGPDPLGLCPRTNGWRGADDPRRSENEDDTDTDWRQIHALDAQQHTASDLRQGSWVPGSVIQFTGALDASTGAYDQGKREGGFALRIYHGITPETDDSCFYFWSAANGYRQDDPTATEQLFNEIAPTFEEDKLILEAQHARLRGSPNPPLVDIDADGARIQARRCIERRLAEEAVTLAAG
jgi:phenylpropionate dioxygenase-like ring-hydroxylating dioxygenase large terminal subunit